MDKVMLDAKKAAQVVMVRAILSVMLDAIKESGPGGAVEGHLYAAMMTTGMSLEQFQTFVQGAIDRGFIRRQGHLLIYVSDTPSVEAPK
jgi:hypothetical protein